MIKKITHVTKGFSISKSFWITYISFNYSHFFLHDSLLTHLTVPNKNLVYIVWEKDSENRKHKDKSRDFSAFCKAFKGSVSGKRQEKSFGSLLQLRRSCFFHSFFFLHQCFSNEDFPDTQTVSFLSYLLSFFSKYCVYWTLLFQLPPMNWLNWPRIEDKPWAGRFKR